MIPTMLLSNEQLLNKATGMLAPFITTTPDNYWRGMFQTNLGFIKVYMKKGLEEEQNLARAACYFIIDHAEYVISTIDKQQFALAIKNILLGANETQN